MTCISVHIIYVIYLWTCILTGACIQMDIQQSKLYNHYIVPFYRYIYICIHTLLYLYGKSVENITIEIKLYITNTTLLYCYTCSGIHMYRYAYV